MLNPETHDHSDPNNPPEFNMWCQLCVDKAMEEIVLPFPDPEEFTPEELKLLFMMLCENRAGLELEKGLTDHGKTLLADVKRKLGILVVGVDINDLP